MKPLFVPRQEAERAPDQQRSEDAQSRSLGVLASASVSTTIKSTEGELPPLPLTFFENAWDAVPKQCVLEWPEIVAVLSKHERRGTMETAEAAKKRGPLFSPVMYRPGATRGNAGVEGVFAAVADVDCGISPDEFLASFPEGIEVLVTSTHSSTPEKPKFRAVTPLASPVPVSEWPTVWRQFQAHLWNGASDGQAKDAARLYYLPSCPQGAEPFVIHRPGRALDWRTLPPVPARCPTVKAEATPASDPAKATAWDGDDDMLGITAGSGPRPDREGLPGTDFNARADWGADILDRHGWEEVRCGSGDERRWRCSRHAGDPAVQVCATTGHSEADSLHIFCHANGTPFEGEDERNYSKFRALSLLEYGGDDAVCARALRGRGYGEPLATTVVEPRQKRAAFCGLTASELKQLPPPVPLVEGILFRDTLAVLDGDSATYKSFIALDMALSVATGTPWQGRRVRQGAVVYIVAEGLSGMGQRVDAWELRRGHTAPDNCVFVPRAANLTDKGEVQALCEYIQSLPERPALIVIDTLARSIAGAEENSSKDMGLAVEAMDKLRWVCGGATVLALHHVNKAKGDIRGSSALRGAIDTELKTKKERKGVVTLSCEKQKDAEEFEPITLVGESVSVPGGKSSLVFAQSEAAGAAVQVEILDDVCSELSGFGDKGATFTQWKQACKRVGISESTFKRARTALVGNDRVDERDGRYYYLDEPGP